MAYLLTLVQRNRTDTLPRNFVLKKWAIAAAFAFWLLIPVAGFWIAFLYIAPAQLGQDIEHLRQEHDAAVAELEPLQAQYDVIVEENADLRTQLQVVKQQAAELEAKLTIAQTAKIEATSEFKGLEDKVANLERKLVFYEKLMAPANDKAPLQCFNIAADYKNGKLTYGVNIIKNDTKNKDKLTTNVSFRILTGSVATDIDPAKADGKAEHTRQISFTKDYRLTGSFKPETKVKDGIRLLDIKAYGANDKILAHCWKAF